MKSNKLAAKRCRTRLKTFPAFLTGLEVLVASDRVISDACFNERNTVGKGQRAIWKAASGFKWRVTG